MMGPTLSDLGLKEGDKVRALCFVGEGRLLALDGNMLILRNAKGVDIRVKAFWQASGRFGWIVRGNPVSLEGSTWARA